MPKRHSFAVYADLVEFVEVADRVWVHRQEWFDLNLTLVGGATGAVLIDTGVSERGGRALRDEIARITTAPLVAVVNTHEHFDHTFGNGAFADLAIYAHEVAAANTLDAGEAGKREVADDSRADAVLATEPLPAQHTLASVLSLDLGDRHVELIHPGRGHTAGDLVAHVPEAQVLVAGDLVEESAPPAYGPDSFPLDWPASLDLVLALIDPACTVVPGHGAVVSADFVADQQQAIATVAQTMHDLAAAGVRRDQALAAGTWPFPRAALEHAVARGWDQLPRGSLRLPMA